jgi:hypothetical protein
MKEVRRALQPLDFPVLGIVFVDAFDREHDLILRFFFIGNEIEYIYPPGNEIISNSDFLYVFPLSQTFWNFQIWSIHS